MIQEFSDRFEAEGLHFINCQISSGLCRARKNRVKGSYFVRFFVSTVVFTRNLTAPLRCCQQFVFHLEKQPVATSEGSKAGRRLNVTEEKEALVRKLWLEGKITALAKMLGLSRQTCHSVLGNSPAGHAQADKSEQYY